MKLEVKENSKNYACSVVEIKDLFEIEGADNIKRTVVNGNNVVVPKTTEIGSKMLYFVSGTKLSADYCKLNNLLDKEDLNISKMVKGSKLAKHILDCSWGLFFELLEYKTNVVKVNPAYSSQTCSKCNHKAKENRKTQSLFECVKCGHLDNADYNATLNLLQWGQTLMEANVGH